jgi:TrmH family RNA methyltransferase
MTETITSTQNPRLKELRKLAERKHRDRSGLFAAEGEDLLAEALRFGRRPETVFFDAAADDRLAALLAGLDGSVEVVPVATEALAGASSLGSGSRVIGVWKQQWAALESPALADDRPLLFLYRPSDPGNVGTVIRSAHALGAAGVVLSPGSADPHGPKAVRASMGAIFAVAVARAEFDEVIGLQPQRFGVALAAGRGKPLRQVASVERPLFALGSEREGLPDRIGSSCAEIAHIPLESGGAESLNVAMAATLCLYENALHRLPAIEKEPPS